MGSWFAPKMPKPQAPPPVPQLDQAKVMADQQQAIMRARGAATTILTSNQGLPSLGTVGTPKTAGAL